MLTWRTALENLQQVAARAPAESIPDLLAEIERARATAYARLLILNNGQSLPDSNRSPADADAFLTADQVAKTLQVDRKWVYRHATALGAVRLSRKKLRFPSSALERYLARRKAASTRR